MLAIVLQAIVRIGSGRCEPRRDRGRRRRLRGDLLSACRSRLIVLAAGLIGLVGGRLGSRFDRRRHGRRRIRALRDGPACWARSCRPAHPTVGNALAGDPPSGLLLWLVPVAALLLTLGPDSVFGQIAVFFSKMAVVTFGGAYAVLAYVAQQAVEAYGWLRRARCWTGSAWPRPRPAR